MSPLVVLAMVFALAFLAESLTEYFFGIPMDKIEKLKPYKWLLNYVAVIVGILMTLYYKLDLISLIAQFAGGNVGSTTVGFILTGAIIGRGSNYVSDFVAKYIKPAQ